MPLSRMLPAAALLAVVGMLKSVQVQAEVQAEYLASLDTLKSVERRMSRVALCSKINMRRTVERDGSVVCVPSINRGSQRTYFNQPLSMLIDCNGKVKQLEDGIKTSVLANFASKSLDIALLAPRAGGDFPDSIAIRGVSIDNVKHRVKQSRRTTVSFLSGDKEWQHSLSDTKDFKFSAAFSELHYIRKSAISARMWKFENIFINLVALNARCKIAIKVGGIETEPPA